MRTEFGSHFLRKEHKAVQIRLQKQGLSFENIVKPLTDGDSSKRLHLGTHIANNIT